ncbi:thioredoxin family protein [Rufibacter sediminis]|uniref:Thioredoxin fold domain-containing protein n=1 Tax=Rufibacter sediminis TaxID=2762756 RepID=A0ABR6VUE5_9BACT|nr:thioredoxin fold domain-containing protein [Rufibacter sediminis]MBC3540540.1 thioredoxin fold domain-containing protein [Rufibacter sediminis]
MSPFHKRIYSGISLVLLLFGCLFQVQAQKKPGIAFLAASSWEKVLAKAKQERKAVFLYVSTPGCRHCAHMEKDIFPMPEVARFYNATFVSHKINIEDKAQGEALAKQYGITAYPTYLYLSKDGELLHQSGGSKPAAEFILDGKNAFDPTKALLSLKRRYDTGDRSPSLLFHYSNALNLAHQANSPKETVVAEYLATQTPQQLASEENLRYLFSQYLGFHSPATQYFLRNQPRFSPLFKEEEVAHKAKRIITNTAQHAGTQNDTRLLQEVKHAIAAHFKDTSQLSALTTIYFYAGRHDWLPYAKATLEYSQTKANGDWQTLYESAMYLNAFAEDKEALSLGAKIMQQVIPLHKNYENLYLYAQLLQKTGNYSLALQTAKEAIAVAAQHNEDSRQARDLQMKLESRK